VTNSGVQCAVQMYHTLCDCVRFSPTMLPSSPVVSLSSDTIDQLCRENVTGSDLMDLWSSWQRNVETEIWPYNAIESRLVFGVDIC